MADLELLIDDLVFPEGPRWREGRLWFSDMHDHVVMTVDPRGRTDEVARVDTRPSGLGWLPDGRLLVVSMLDRRVLRLEEGCLVEHADLSRLASGHCNDMVVDGEGRAYVGNFGFDLDAGEAPRETNLALVHPDGRAEVAAEGLLFPNGSVITPDAGTLVVGESFGARLTAFRIDGGGRLSQRREWGRVEGAVPDGICLDAEGAIWMASPISNEVVRVREGGEVTQRIATDRMAIACMLGGDDGRTLFVLTAKTTSPDETPKLRSGRIECVRVEVPGAGWP